MAYDKGTKFSCPWCADVEIFQENMLANGIYIPSFIEENNNECNNNTVVDAVGDLNVNDACGGSNDVVTSPPKTKKRRLQKNWLLEMTFNNKDDALAAINEENTWSYGYDNDTSAGKRITYRCNKVLNIESQISN